MNMIIVGPDCDDCIHCTAVNDDNPGRVKVYCSQADKYRWWGQCIQCEHYEKRKNNGTDELS